MPRVVGIKFEHNLKMYFFETRNFDLHYGQKCVVETVLGLEMGEVVKRPFICENIKNNDECHKLSSEEIFNKLIKIL